MRIIIALIFLSGINFANAVGLDGCQEHVKYGAPSQDSTLLCRLGYAVSHDDSKKIPRWVAYHLTADKVSGTIPRKDSFRADQDLPEIARAKLSDYSGSGFDRGHMAPAAAMKWSERAMRESFLLTNMSPQVGIGFNRHIWSSLEARVRKWTKERGELYVVTGSIFDSDRSHLSLDAVGDNVAIPSHFFKIAFDPIKLEAIAFILPNKKTPTSELPSFIVSIDEIESKTGLDFLPAINNSIEAVIESTIQQSIW